MLAVDVSGSVDEIEMRLQREGYIAALRHPDVIEAIQRGMVGRIAVTYFEWAGDDYQRTMLDWTVIEDASGAEAFADALAEAPMATAHWTSLSAAIDYAVPLFQDNGIEGARRVIDLSSDGYNNRGRPVEAARDQAIATGITINGLPMVNNRPNPWGGPAAEARPLLRGKGDRRPGRVPDGGHRLHGLCLGDPVQAAARDCRRDAAFT